MRSNTTKTMLRSLAGAQPVLKSFLFFALLERINGTELTETQKSFFSNLAETAFQSTYERPYLRAAVGLSMAALFLAIFGVLVIIALKSIVNVNQAQEAAAQEEGQLDLAVGQQAAANIAAMAPRRIRPRTLG